MSIRRKLFVFIPLIVVLINSVSFFSSSKAAKRFRKATIS